MRYSFLILFGLLFMGLNAVNAQSCAASCAKASTAAVSNSVEKKSSCSDMAKVSTSTASATTKCSEVAATAAAQTPVGIATFVSGGANLKASTTKSCDPSACDQTKATANATAKCDPSSCIPSGATKASTAAKTATKTSKATTSL